MKFPTPLVRGRLVKRYKRCRSDQVLVIFGKVANDHVAGLDDANGREILFLSLLAAAVLVMGVWPQPFLEVMHVSVEELLRQAGTTKLEVLTAR